MLFGISSIFNFNLGIPTTNEFPPNQSYGHIEKPEWEQNWDVLAHHYFLGFCKESKKAFYSSLEGNNKMNIDNWQYSNFNMQIKFMFLNKIVPKTSFE